MHNKLNSPLNFVHGSELEYGLLIEELGCKIWALTVVTLVRSVVFEHNTSLF